MRFLPHLEHLTPSQMQTTATTASSRVQPTGRCCLRIAPRNSPHFGQRTSPRGTVDFLAGLFFVFGVGLSLRLVVWVIFFVLDCDIAILLLAAFDFSSGSASWNQIPLLIRSVQIHSQLQSLRLTVAFRLGVKHDHSTLELAQSKVFVTCCSARA